MTIVPRATRRGVRLDWVKFDFDLARDGSVDPTDKALYAAIASFVDMDTRESPETTDVDLNGIPRDVPTRKRLAACIGRSLDTVDRSTRRLENLGLLRVHRQEDPGNPKLSLPSEYELLDHHLWDQRAAERAASRAARRGVSAEQRGGRMDAATPGGTGAATPGRTDAAVRDKREVEEENGRETGDVPSARSAVGVRSTSSSGSSQPGDGSGFAAAAKESSSSDQAEATAGVPGQRKSNVADLSREQLDAVRAVEGVLPTVLLDRLPYRQFPKRNRPAVLEALESRTVDQLRDRAERRWLAYGYEPALYDGTLTAPVGAALELIAPPRYCPDLSCEDGEMIDTGADCRACLERRCARRAARAAGQKVDTGSSKGAGRGQLPECVICQAPFPGAVPDDGECLRCRREAAAAAQALSARLGSPGADWSAQAVEPTAGAPDDVQEQQGVDEETARLRAMYASRYGTPAQVEAYCTNAPF